MGNVLKRHALILEQINENGYVSVQELGELLDVSEVTIRKDLKTLENKKQLLRTHGGASAASSLTTDLHIDVKEKLKLEEKERIGRVATQLLEPDDKIIIASGTTLLAFSRQIVNLVEQITVITASVKVSLSLCYSPNIEIFQLGGRIRKNSVSVVGHYFEDSLKSLSCNKLFLGVDGFELNHGLTTSDIEEANINKKMIDAAEEIIILTDSSKFGKRGFCKICDVEKIHHVITDKEAPMHIVEMLRERGIEVTLV